MGKGKLKKFAELETMQNVIQKPEPELLSGTWNQVVFHNDNPITLELACGKGDYTLALAQKYPNRNFIGLDIKGNRIHVGARRALQKELVNVHFLRDYIDHIDSHFAVGEVDEIWITFPDPFLKTSRAKKRLTSPNFISRYKNILKKGGSIHLKTDSPELFSYTLEVIEELKLPIVRCFENVYDGSVQDPLLTDIQTYYEKMHLAENRIIRYIQFQIE